MLFAQHRHTQQLRSCSTAWALPQKLRSGAASLHSAAMMAAVLPALHKPSLVLHSDAHTRVRFTSLHVEQPCSQ